MHGRLRGSAWGRKGQLPRFRWLGLVVGGGALLGARSYFQAGYAASAASAAMCGGSVESADVATDLGSSSAPSSPEVFFDVASIKHADVVAVLLCIVMVELRSCFLFCLVFCYRLCVGVSVV